MEVARVVGALRLRFLKARYLVLTFEMTPEEIGCVQLELEPRSLDDLSVLAWAGVKRRWLNARIHAENGFKIEWDELKRLDIRISGIEQSSFLSEDSPKGEYVPGVRHREYFPVWENHVYAL